MDGLSKGNLVNIRLAFLAFGLVLAAAGPAISYEETAITDGGSVKGVVKFTGAIPKRSSIPVGKNQDVCGASKPSETLLVGPNQGVKYTVILVENVRQGKTFRKEVSVDNSQCAFIPRVAAVMVGGKIKIKNSDDILHNTHGYLSRATVFNLALPRRHQQIDITAKLKRPGIVDLWCDAHTHMRGWLVVHDSPYFAVTDESGNFLIDGIPPGKYKITMWHESWVEKGRDKDGRVLYGDPIVSTKEVAIAPSATVTVEFELKSFNAS
jgi:plastocyanin